MEPQKKTQKKGLGETVATRIPADILQAIDEEVVRREAAEAGDPVSRSTVIRESLRRQLLRGKASKKAERIGRSVIASTPKCESLGCPENASHMQQELDVRTSVRTRKWWCKSHCTADAVAVDFVVEVRAVPIKTG